ncbi:LuxR C-terminal-related transcriptional regulator [Vibrio rhizosphaerae]|uniref:LuxR C-terminal-related transcriptional regulator n=1 Tax=Vibrio rhizosphaerae TaxID=398736 RepID=A0ABU4IZF7_9VIBR|nr:LuxR C-terminal-related transcriptional regulator [Vibrio rhizosphaerae]MDW6094801.1 LuxR C-terminal-related transcriptional regulator [Vibrio rhizosphaerae]
MFYHHSDANNATIHGIADLILAIGEPEFFDKLTYLLRTAASFDDYVMLIYHPSKAPTVLRSSFAVDEIAVWDKYLQGAYLLSPFYDYCANQGNEGLVTLDEIAPDDFYHSAYYEEYFRPSQLIDETCFCVQGRNNNVYLLSLGRTETLAKFNPRVLTRLRALYPILSSTVKMHDNQKMPPERDSNMQVKEYIYNFGAGVLTPRENQVMQLLIRGYSSKEAARLLEISYETERVHRKNIYSKLEVSSQHELLAKIFDDLVNLEPASHFSR